jgi:hypothetical protein
MTGEELKRNNSLNISKNENPKIVLFSIQQNTLAFKSTITYIVVHKHSIEKKYCAASFYIFLFLKVLKFWRSDQIDFL